MKALKQKSIVFSSLLSLIYLLCFVFLIQQSFWKNIEYWSYDWLSVLNPPKIAQTDIIIVSIDNPSFQEIGLQWPWPRAVHAQLVDSLTNAGAAIIVFDIIFSDPSLYGEEDDKLFASAIKNSNTIVLASDVIWQESAQGLLYNQLEPLQQFLDSGAHSGLVHVQPSNDGILRQLPNGDGVLWEVIGQLMHSKNEQNRNNKTVKKNTLVHFIGEANSFPSVHYYQALDPSLLAKDTFKDRMVLVGLDLRAAPEVEQSTVDRFKTPFYRLQAQDTAGVEIHANFLENIKHNLMIVPISNAQHIFFLVLLTLVTSLLFSKWQLRKSTIHLLLAIVLLVSISWLAFIYLKIWVPIISSLALLLLIFNSNALIAYLRERNQKLFLHNAFSHYVSSHILDDIMDNPEKLKLGGERRVVTLMFTDIAGFTTISEKLPAEQTAQLLNLYLSKMSQIITKHGGTLDKYIGDAIMAFWGAPIDHPQHPYKACLAALEMQLEADKLRLEFIKQGFPEVRMRIGIHTGEAIIGNMGSTELFDYSALGDNVNLAARLEGVNKQYNTWIMISEVTAKHVKDQFNLQLVDKVCVKGKTVAIEIFTFVKDKQLSELSAQALNYYLEQKWDLSKQHWHKLLAIDCENSIAKLYLKRIETYQISPPEEDWQGITILTSK